MIYLLLCLLLGGGKVAIEAQLLFNCVLEVRTVYQQNLWVKLCLPEWVVFSYSVVLVAA